MTTKSGKADKSTVCRFTCVFICSSPPLGQLYFPHHASRCYWFNPEEETHRDDRMVPKSERYLQLSGLGEPTREAYVRELRMLCDFYHKTPDQISESERYHNPVVRSSWQSVVEELRTRWIRAGLDLVQPFQVAWYNGAAADGFRLPDFGRPSALEILVANTRAIWTALPRRLAREPARARRAQAARELLEAAVLPALEPLTCCSEVRMGAGSPPRRVSNGSRTFPVSRILKWCLMRPYSSSERSLSYMVLDSLVEVGASNI